MSIETYLHSSHTQYFHQAARVVPDLTGQIIKAKTFSFAYGGHGDIWEGEWIQEPSEGPSKVAVKVIKGLEDPAIRQKFLREMCVWSTLDHPRITRLLGIVFDFDRPQAPGLVSVYYEHGDIRKYVENQPDGNKLVLISQVASGIDYMHGREVIHGDIKPTNILVTDKGEASITDFGLSRVLDIPGFTTAASGTLRYMPPELAKSHEEESMAPVTEATDVWEFGMTVLEILTGDIPFSHIKRDASVTHFVVSGGRPKRTRFQQINNEIWKVLEKCWSTDPTQRPSMTCLSSFFASQVVESASL